MKKVLVVDDAKNIRMLLTKCLELEGYQVKTATNGKDALALFSSERFDLAFLDIKLPELSGTEVLRRIRALRSRTGKLLALSAFLPLFLQAAIYWLYNLGWWPLGVLSLPFLSYGVFFLLVNAALAGVLLSVFRMDALVRDTAWASSAPAPRPSALDIPLGRGQLHIEYRKGTQHF